MNIFFILLILSTFINNNFILTSDISKKENQPLDILADENQIKKLLNFDKKNYDQEIKNEKVKLLPNSKDTQKKEKEEKNIKSKTENSTQSNTQDKLKEEEKQKKELINFNYENEDITKIINKLISKKQIKGIIFPQPTGKIPAKVTFTKYDLTIDEAWQLIITWLNLAGYTIIEKKNFYEIKKNEDVVKEPLEIYINTIEKLPDSDQKIRYIYFLENISISENSSPSYINLDQILKDMVGSENEGGSYILDGTTNSIIITEKASTIKAVMKIIKEIDTAGFPEAIEVTSLQHTKADYISKIITQLIPGSPEPQFRYGPFPPKQMRIGGYYISEQTKIVPIERTNSIAILGPPDSVSRIRDFIVKHLDLPIESEKSVIHIKPLQYLNADELAPVLQDLVKAKGSAAQAEAVISEKDSLANVIVVAEKQVQAAAIQPTAAAQQQAAPAAPATAPIVGGNRLIVAARAKDWQLINGLIDQLDQQQLQVALEVLVCDLNLTDTQALGTQLRNSLNCSTTQNFNFQSVQLSNTTWLNYIDNDSANAITPQGVASDLLRYTKPAATADTPSGINQQIAANATPGSTIFSFRNGNGISLVLQLLKNYSSTTILSQPFVITKNNLQANISVAREIFKEMGVDNQSTGGPIIRQRKPIKADLTVNILPRISKSSDINLEIVVNVNDFLAGTNDNVITTRQVRTNTNLKNKEVLVIGGLARVDTEDSMNETPLIGQIPIIGYLFKRKSQKIEKNNLMIFISPTIIRPRLQGGIDTFTKGKIDFIKDQVLEGECELLGSNFEQLRDPITRVYFEPLGKQINTAIDYYVEQKAYKAGSESELSRSEVVSEIVTDSSEKENAAKIQNMINKDENPLLKK